MRAVRSLRLVALLAAGVAAVVPVMSTSAVQVVMEVEAIVIPAGLAGNVCTATFCSFGNGSVGSGCTEVEIEDPGATTSPIAVQLGEGLDHTLCQAFISGSVFISGCTVSGSGTLSFSEDIPVGGAAGGTFPFQVSGSMSDAVMFGTYSPSPANHVEDVAIGLADFGPCNGFPTGTMTYTAVTLFEQPPPV